MCVGVCDILTGRDEGGENSTPGLLNASLQTRCDAVSSAHKEERKERGEGEREGSGGQACLVHSRGNEEKGWNRFGRNEFDHSEKRLKGGRREEGGKGKCIKKVAVAWSMRATSRKRNCKMGGCSSPCSVTNKPACTHTHTHNRNGFNKLPQEKPSRSSSLP